MKSTVDSSSGEQFTAAEKVEFNNEILASSRTASATLGDKMISKANLELVRPVCENGGGDAAGGRIAVYQTMLDLTDVKTLHGVLLLFHIYTTKQQVITV